MGSWSNLEVDDDTESFVCPCRRQNMNFYHSIIKVRQFLDLLFSYLQPYFRIGKGINSCNSSLVIISYFWWLGYHSENIGNSRVVKSRCALSQHAHA